MLLQKVEVLILSSFVLLVLEQQNRGEMYIGDWEKREWKVFSDGSYILETTFSQVNDKHRVTSSFNKYKFLLLKQLLKLDWDKHVRDSDGDDGEAWKMQMLNKAGEIIKKSGRSKYPWYNPIFNVIVNFFFNIDSTD